MRYALLLLALMAGCQTENVSVYIQREGQSVHNAEKAKVWYNGNYAEANDIFIISINRSPIKQGQDQETDVNAEASGLPGV